MSENNVYELYGSMVFNDEAMRRRLPKEVYKSLTRTIATGKTIDASIAECRFWQRWRDFCTSHRIAASKVSS